MIVVAAVAGLLCIAPVCGAGEPRVVDRPAEYSGVMVFSPDHASLAIAEEDHSLRLVDFKTGATSGLLNGHKGKILAVAFSPDGNRVSTAARDDSLRLWDAKTHRELAHADVPHGISLAFSPDGQTLVCGHVDAKAKFVGLKFWAVGKDGQLRSTRAINTLVPSLGPSYGMPRRVKYSTNGRWIAFGVNDINILDVSRGTVRYLRNEETANGVTAGLLFFDDRGWLVSAHYSGMLIVWDITTGTEVFRLSTTGPDSKALAIRVTSLARVPGTETVLTASEWHTITAWDLGARIPPQNSVWVTLPDRPDPLHKAFLTLSEDASGLAVSHDKKCYLFDANELLQPK